MFRGRYLVTGLHATVCWLSTEFTTLYLRRQNSFTRTQRTHALLLYWTLWIIGIRDIVLIRLVLFSVHRNLTVYFCNMTFQNYLRKWFIRDVYNRDHKITEWKNKYLFVFLYLNQHKREFPDFIQVKKSHLITSDGRFLRNWVGCCPFVIRPIQFRSSK
jgi:hypothetical protein